MSRVFICSDLHLGHRNIIKYRKKPDGTEFESVAEHDQFIIDGIKATVGKRDTLIILGDCFFAEDRIPLLREVQCAKKVLVLGNHCTEYVSIDKLVPEFSEIHGMLKRKSIWYTHAPVHPNELRGRLNIHGHIHSADSIRKDTENSWAYFNASIEEIDYKPIQLSLVQTMLYHQLVTKATEQQMDIKSFLVSRGFKAYKVLKSLGVAYE